MDQRVSLYRLMVRIRVFEQTALTCFCNGKMGGWLLMDIGQESIATVVRSLMGPEDHSISGPRGLGHALAAGIGMGPIMAEFYGRTGGCSKGKGGAFSFFDPAKGFWGCHGLAAAQTPLALGLAYALKYQEKPGAVICFLGDGATNQGVYHESLNLAGLFDLPVVYLIENNGYAMGMSEARSSRFRGSLAQRAEGYDIQWDRFTDKDPYEMRVRIHAALLRARNERKPTVLEIETYRYHGFTVADSQAKKYRTPEEIEGRKTQDPLLLWRQRLIADGFLDEHSANAIKAEAQQEAKEAVIFAGTSPPPRLQDITRDVYWETDNETPASRIGRHFFTD